MSVDLSAVERYLMQLQDRLCTELETLDGKSRFEEDAWRRDGATGRTRTIAAGAVFEKGGVNFSRMSGRNLPGAATARRPELAKAAFDAMGVSLVLHPLNPYVPTAHMNVRCFSAQPAQADPAWWFGGGFDLTPCYGFEDDARHWHRTARDACAAFGADVHPRLKKSCDEYFHLRHRGEARGIGGLFFDDLNEWGFDRCFAFLQSVGDHFLPAWLPIARRRMHETWGERERDFQLYRRGRYVEFNLVQDRGTLFGLQSGGRTESILVSMPPLAAWRYDWKPQPGSREAELYERFLPPRDWLAD